MAKLRHRVRWLAQVPGFEPGQCGSHSHHANHHIPGRQPRMGWVKCFADCRVRCKMLLLIFFLEREGQSIYTSPTCGLLSTSANFLKKKGASERPVASVLCMVFGRSEENNVRGWGRRAEKQEEHLRLLFCESIYPYRENMENREKKKDSPHSHHLNISTVSILEYLLLFFFKRSSVLVVCSRKSTQRIWNTLMIP